MSTLFKHPIWAMAFRPFYSLAALYGALSILLWGFGYQGTPELSGFYWHAHEMIWGYAGLVVIAFLLTAVATWTGQPPTRGGALAGLTAFWLAARIAVFIPGWGAVASGIAGTVFFWYGAVCMAIPVYRSRNKRNYIAVFAIFVLGGTHVAFHRHLSPLDGMALLNGLVAGLIMVAAFIGLIGTRIISFFTSKRLNIPQVPSPQWLALSALVLPMIAAMLTAHQFLLPLAALFTFAAGIINLIQVCRWWNNAILKEPMLWILFAGYFFTALGLTAIGLSHFKLQLLNLGVHLLNLGSGRAYSVLEIVRAFEAASGLTIPYQIKPRREGDLACVYADPTYTKQQTGWETKRDLTQMMEDAWRWVSRNPNGYGD